MKIQYIILRKCDDKEYFYGPFVSIKKAWDWAEEELSLAQSKGEMKLLIKQIYNPIES